MRISVEKLVKKFMQMSLDETQKKSPEAAQLRDYLKSNGYLEAYKKACDLDAKILKMQMELGPLQSTLKTVVDFKFDKPKPAKKQSKKAATKVSKKQQ